MKHVFTIIALLFSFQTFAQNYTTYLNFDDPYELFRVRIDTLANPDNIWQVGSPQKHTFNGAFSAPNAIVTDTIHYYPENDTSQFTLVQVTEGGFNNMGNAFFSGEYRVDSDSLSDYGSIEFSPDNGTTWINLLTDTYYYELGLYEWFNPGKPVLSGHSDGWQSFSCHLTLLGEYFQVWPGDTVLYRFTFISDSIQTDADGLMFDNFEFYDYIGGVNDLSTSETIIDVFPVPALESVSIAYDNALMQNHQILIFDEMGKLMYNQNMQKSNSLILDLSKWESGNYFIRLNNTETKQSSTGKFIKAD